MHQHLNISLIALALCAGCAEHPHWVTTAEKKHGTTIVHHRRRVSNGSVDRIESIDSKGIVTEAEVHVYDVGRLPTGDGGMHEAHRYYQVVQSEYPNLSLPKKVTRGPKTVYEPPNYSPMPKDQRINDAVTEAQQAKDKLLAAEKEIKRKLEEDNNLRGEQQASVSPEQAIQDEAQAGMNTPKKSTDAEKAAAASVDQLKLWGSQQ